MQSLKRDTWTRQDYLALQAYLQSIGEPELAAFHTKLIPGVQNVVGIRAPVLKKMAKEIAAGNWQQYLTEVDAQTHEELLLQAYVLGFLKTDPQLRIALLEDFLPFVTNWAVCDSLCAGQQAIRREREAFLPWILSLLQNEREYDVRCGVVLLMDHYMTADHIQLLLTHFCKIKREEYYINMAVAWALSICYVQFAQQTVPVLQAGTLSPFVHNKAIQKACESRRVSDADKRMLRSLRIPTKPKRRDADA